MKHVRLTTGTHAATFRIKILVMILFTASALQVAAGDARKPVPARNSSSVAVNSSRSGTQQVYVLQESSRDIRFYTEAVQKGKAYQLYLFDLDGRLVYESRMLKHKGSVIKVPGRGNYLFELFSNDTRITSGSIAVR